jgi:hypothetical protein
MEHDRHLAPAAQPLTAAELQAAAELEKARQQAL